MRIIVASPGRPRCQETEHQVFNACAELNLDADISHVPDVKQFAAMGVIMTPAVMVDGKVVISGKIPTREELKTLLRPTQA